MAEGVFVVHRGIFKHDLFEGEPYTQREAWLWLVGTAAWKDSKVRLGGKMVELKRGQLAYATRFLGSVWKWPEARVRRFLKLLQSERMIDAEPTRWATLITICKYNEYQFAGRGSDAESDAEVTQNRRGSDANKKKDNNLRKEDAASRTPEADLYDRGKQVLGPSSGGLISKVVKAKGGNIPLARAAIELAATKSDPREYIGAIINKRDGPEQSDTVIINGYMQRFTLSQVKGQFDGLTSP